MRFFWVFYFRRIYERERVCQIWRRGLIKMFDILYQNWVGRFQYGVTCAMLPWRRIFKALNSDILTYCTLIASVHETPIKYRFYITSYLLLCNLIPYSYPSACTYLKLYISFTRVNICLPFAITLDIWISV